MQEVKMANKKYKVVEATKEDLDYLYDQSALTFEGTTTDEDNLNYIYRELEQINSRPKPEFTYYFTTGKMMNEVYGLTGDNAYQNDFHLVAIPLEHFADPRVLPTWRIGVAHLGVRWFDDIVDNNARREEEKN